MMGECRVDQEHLFYEFSLERHVPETHLLRSIDRFVELDGLRCELAPFYSEIACSGDCDRPFRPKVITDSHVYIWDMRNPMAAALKERLTLRSGRGSHWLTFDIRGDYGYVAPDKNSAEGTEIFNARTHASVGVIRSSEDMLEIDFADGKISQVSDQYGIGRR
jgi:hypothetical protein